MPFPVEPAQMPRPGLLLGYIDSGLEVKAVQEVIQIAQIMQKSPYF